MFVNGYKKLVIFFIRRIYLLIMLLFAATEIAIRLSGAVDFPIYLIDDDIGYVVKPNQSGFFLNRNEWIFNDRSMGTNRNWVNDHNSDLPNLLLIGNSIVMGGNPYDQRDKLGPLLQSRLGNAVNVWPAAVGGWSNVNEIAYLQRNLDVVEGVDFFIWEYMNGGFSQLSASRSEYVFPTSKPLCATWYVVRRYILPTLINFDMNELPPKGDSRKKYIDQFEQLISKMSASGRSNVRGIILLYPTREEFLNNKIGHDYVSDRSELERIALMYHLALVDISKNPAWNEKLYRDGVHPTVEGNNVLANILNRTVVDAVLSRLK